MHGFEGEPEPRGEIHDLRWFRPDELETVLHAPYHDSFRRWLRGGGREFRSIWAD